MRILLVLTILILGVPAAKPAFAQSSVTDHDFSAGSDIKFLTEEEKKKQEEQEKQEKEGKGITESDIQSSETEITVIEDEHAGKYVDATLENISKLYWKKNILKEENDTAIDNFLRINECEMYERYYTDDFEWMRIRDAARDMLKETKDNFPYKFKVVLPIDLGRYDMMRKGFPLINKTAFKDLRRIEIGGNSYHSETCGQDGIIDYYPRNLVLILNKPFNFDFIELDEHIAQAYIIRQKYDPAERPFDIRHKHYDRLAFARVRITFSEFQGTTRDSGNLPLAVMFGKLDGIDIFEDAHEKRLLYTADYR